MNWLFGGGVRQVGHVVEQVGGVFRPNAEADAKREHDYNSAALTQYAAEYHTRTNRTALDSLADGLNRLVRPMVTSLLFGALPYVVITPEHAAISIASLQLLPTEYWVLLGTVLSFYFGGRMQIKAQDFQKSIAEAVVRAPQVIENISRLRTALSPGTAEIEDPDLDLEISQGRMRGENPAVEDWRRAAA